MMKSRSVKDNKKSISQVFGVGLGLRSKHYEYVLENRPPVPWFEVVAENYMGIKGGSGGRPLRILEKIRENYPIVLHGVSLSIGSVDPLNMEYLKNLKELVSRVQPSLISDHFCWTGVAKENLHDLLPLPYTKETINHIVPRIQKVQDYLGRRILLENVSSYISFTHSEMTEWEFISEVSNLSNCDLLVDVNNIFVSSVNHRFDPMDFINGLPKDRVKQFHLAGYSEQEGYLLDSHDHPVTAPVWNLYKNTVKLFGSIPTLIEWDADIPEFEILQEQAAKATKIQEGVFGEQKYSKPASANTL